MKRLLVLFALCMLSAAMVPRERRSDTNSMTFCAERTPCAWQTYNPTTKAVLLRVPNIYCVCGKEQQCAFHKEDTESKTYEFRCRSAGAD